METALLVVTRIVVRVRQTQLSPVAVHTSVLPSVLTAVVVRIPSSAWPARAVQ